MESPGPLRSLVADPRHGALPALLLALTVLTGLVDAVSILSLGRVFVANMTGNVVFVGFALAGAEGFSLSASLSALAGFLVGALVAGRAVARSTRGRAAMLAAAAAAETALLGVALAVLLAAHDRPASAAVNVVAAVLAVALGLQNGVVRHLAVPDLTTTVLTMTLTGIAADLRSGTVVVRRVLAVVAMLGGAVLGALVVLHRGPSAALACALAVTLAVALAASVARRRETPSG